MSNVDRFIRAWRFASRSLMHAGINRQTDVDGVWRGTPTRYRQFYCCLQGSVEVLAPNFRCRLQEHEACIVPRFEQMEERWQGRDGVMRNFVASFDVTVSAGNDDPLSFISRPVACFLEADVIKQVEALGEFAAFRYPLPFPDVLRAHSSFEHILSEYMIVAVEKNFVDNPMRGAPTWILAVANYLCDHHRDKETNIWTLARISGFGPDHVRHTFRKYFGISPGQYLKHIRLERARRQLLNEPDQKISQLAYECGYQSVDHFIRDFRKQYGASPKKWRTGQLLGGDRPAGL